MTLQDEINNLLTCRGVALGTLSAEEVGTWNNGVYVSGIKPSFVPSTQLDAIIAAYQAGQSSAPTAPVANPTPPVATPSPTSGGTVTPPLPGQVTTPPVSPSPAPSPTPPAPAPIPSPSGSSSIVTNPSIGAARKAFTGADLHWRDIESTQNVEITLTLTDKSVLTFQNGPVGATPFTTQSGAPHSHLVVVRYVDGVVIENPWVDSTQNFSGHLTVVVDGTTVFDQDNVNFYLHCGTAIIRTGFKQFTPVDIRNQVGKLLPNYNNPGTFHSFAPVDLGINGRGYCTYQAMGSTGGRQEIGLIPGSDLAYAIRGEQWQAARDGSDHFRGCAACVRDPNTGLPLDPSIWPTVSLLEAHLGYVYGAHGSNPVTVMSGSPVTPDPAHQPHFGVVPFLATGSDFDMETLLFWASYQGIWNNAAYRQYENFIVSDTQTRGMAWGIATFGYAAKLLAGRHPQAQVYRDALTRTATYYWTEQLAPGMPQNNMFGVFPELPYEDAQGHCRATATWQNAFLASALHLMVQYGFDEFKDWRDSSAALPVNIAQNMCYQLMSIYCLAVVDPVKYKSDSQALAGGEYYTSWNGVMNDSMANKYNDENDYGGNGTSPQIGTLCGKLTFNSTVGGLFGSSGSFISFAANIQPAIAAAVDAGIPGATDAWTKFQQWSGHIDYTYGAEFNIVPVAV